MNLVEQIHTAIKSKVTTALGASYKELQFVFDVSKNSERGMASAYGVRPLAASNASGVTQHYTLDQQFEVILTGLAARTNSDSDKFTLIFSLYDKVDEIFNTCFLTKLGLPSIVMIVDSPNISEVEFFDENQFIVLRFTMNIKYRRQIA